MCLQELLRGLGRGKLADAELLYARGCPEHVGRALWNAYTAYRTSCCIVPFHERSYNGCRIKLFRMGHHCVKEYQGGRDMVMREVAILQQLHHDTLLGFLVVADEGWRISLIMDWAGEDLREHRTLSAPTQYSEQLVRHIMHQLTHALAYLHAKGIVHRDVKPDNISIHPDMRVQLFDWNEALLLKHVEGLTDRELARDVGVAGTPLFLPPEVLNYIVGREMPSKQQRSLQVQVQVGDVAHQHEAEQPPTPTPQQLQLQQQQHQTLRATIGPALDVWGLGTVLFFLLAGRDIFLDDSTWELDALADVASASDGVELPEGVPASEAARDFLRRCLDRDPESRATAKELAHHPWLCGTSSQGPLYVWATQPVMPPIRTHPSSG